MFKPNTRFLVVDDFATMRKAVKATLQILGFNNIVEAVDGKHALEILNESQKANTPIEFIFSDWTMPNLNGIELLKSVKQNSAYSQIPFVLVTAESEQANIVEALKAGVSEYIVKPFNPQILKTKIEKVYQKSPQKEKKVA